MCDSATRTLHLQSSGPPRVVSAVAFGMHCIDHTVHLNTQRKTTAGEKQNNHPTFYLLKTNTVSSVPKETESDRKLYHLMRA